MYYSKVSRNSVRGKGSGCEMDPVTVASACSFLYQCVNMSWILCQCCNLVALLHTNVIMFPAECMPSIGLAFLVLGMSFCASTKRQSQTRESNPVVGIDSVYIGTSLSSGT